MFKKLTPLVLASSLFAGCATVPMESSTESDKAKAFNSPSEGHAGIYIYRDSAFGSALKKDVWVDGKCIGESAPKVFFYVEVDGGKKHKISTESEFSPNDLLVYTKPSQNYFVRQYIKMGLFVGGANLELVDPEKGKKDIGKLKLAKKGTCSK